MKTNNAYKIIEKAGSKLEKDTRYFHGLIARFGYYNIELTNQDSEITAVKVVPANEKPEPVSDYYPGTYFKSLTHAIEYVLPRRVDGNPHYEQSAPVLPFTLEHKLCDARPGSIVPEEIWSAVFTFDAKDKKDADNKAHGWARYHSFSSSDVRVRPATAHEAAYWKHNEWVFPD